MTIAIDLSPLKTGHFLQHRVRGAGFYLENLKKSLLQYYPDNKYIFFTRGEKLPEDVDLVHYPYFEPFFKTLPFSKTGKTVVTVHDLIPLIFPDHFPSGIKGKIKWQMQKFNLKRADAVITDSISSKKDIVEYAGIKENKVHVVYLAAGEHFQKYRISNIKYQMLRKKYNLPDKFALYVGDATWNKNLPRLVEAIESINTPLIMVGKALVDNQSGASNPWNRDIVRVRKKIQQSNNSTRKQFQALGFVSTEDLVSLYNLATLFVMPSLYEGFGLPVLEAMVCGAPVITSKEGSIPEVAGEAAFYIDAYDTKSIAKGIKKVFEDKELQQTLSTKGERQAKKFSWQKTIAEVMKTYGKL